MSRLALALGFLLLVAAGCGLTPPTEPPTPEPPPPYPIRNTPENAIEYLRLAWERKDSLAVDSVDASDYEGISTDLADPGGTSVLSFTERQEIDAVANLRRDPLVGTVIFSLPASILWERIPYANDPPTWVSILIKQNISLTVYKTNPDDRDDTGWGVDASKFEFTLKPVGSLWEIVRWKEIRETSPS
jgi:hypothetical protein